MHPDAGEGVQGAEGLVGQESLGFSDQRAGERHALLLAAGELVGPQQAEQEAGQGARQHDLADEADFSWKHAEFPRRGGFQSVSAAGVSRMPRLADEPAMASARVVRSRMSATSLRTVAMTRRMAQAASSTQSSQRL
jgi:hypothetical protein